MSPGDLLYTKEHEWLRIEGDAGVVGITDHAQEELGDVVYVELPKPGTKFDSGEVFGSIESVKAVSDLFIPVSGEIVEVNAELSSAPERINADPYGTGWLIRVRLSDKNETANLLSADQYEAYIKEA